MRAIALARPFAKSLVQRGAAFGVNRQAPRVFALEQRFLASGPNAKRLAEASNKLLTVVAQELEEETGDDQLGLSDEVKQALDESAFKLVPSKGRQVKFESTDANSPFSVSITFDPAELEYPDDALQEDAGEAGEEQAPPAAATTVPACIEVKPRKGNGKTLLIKGLLYSEEEGSPEEDAAYFSPEKMFVTSGDGQTKGLFSPAVEFLDGEFQDALSAWLEELGVDAALCENLVEFAAVREHETYVAWLGEVKSVVGQKKP
jgi:hypothetical protein